MSSPYLTYNGVRVSFGGAMVTGPGGCYFTGKG